MTATTLQTPTFHDRSRAKRPLETLGLWLARQRQRRRLAELTRAELEDIGISRGEALAEARKPFWRA